MSEALEILKSCDAFLEGHFLLSSGRHSSAYCQMAYLQQYPDRCAEVMKAVADQIKKLAEQSAEGVDTIKQVADNIFAKSNECVSMVHDVQTLLRKEQDDISATCSSFATLSKTISDNIVAVTRISEKSKQLDGIKQSIIANITDLSAISEENAASNEEVSANVTSIAEAIDQMNTATGHVSKVSDELAEMMKYFE